ncbi:MAG: winged helix-turn-helix transcriptional regulator [Thermoproteus sp.]|nr:winged helix-turn-helix transcriptional regulator [Thermoproteus sp.]
MIWAILLFANGTVLLLFNQTVAASVLALQLPSPPLSMPVVKLDGVPIPAVLNGSVLQVPVAGRSLVTVMYVPRVKAVDGLLTFNVTDGDYVIWVQGGVLLLPYLRILNFTYVNNTLIAVAKGPGQIAYALQGGSPQPTITTTTTVASQSATPSAPSQSTAAAASSSTQSNAAVGAPAQPNLLAVLAYAVPAAAAVVIALLALRRRSRTAAELSDTDRAIMAYLRRRGGAYESEIARDLGIPRTTVFRAVRRLEQRGVVRTEKRDGRNYVMPA